MGGKSEEKISGVYDNLYDRLVLPITFVIGTFSTLLIYMGEVSLKENISFFGVFTPVVVVTLVLGLLLLSVFLQTVKSLYPRMNEWWFKKLEQYSFVVLIFPALILLLAFMSIFLPDLIGYILFIVAAIIVLLPTFKESL